MKFERGKDIKESLRVGKAGNPIKVETVRIESPYKGKEYLQHSYCLDDENAIGVLRASKHSIPDLRTDVEEGTYSIRLDLSEKLDAKDGKQKIQQVYLEDIRGEYVEYKGEIYPILFPVEISMNITIGPDGIS